MHPSCLAVDELLRDCQVRSDRRSGPGGQHRNKVETAIIIVHRPTGILAEANERRSQLDNRRVALWRLRLALAVRHRTADSGLQASVLWRSRAKQRRISVAAEHEDFPALLAEAMDRLLLAEYSVPECAAFFDVAASQLVKLLKQWPQALTQINAARLDRGLHKLT